jgi:sugar/nucleoside kinase (ribokinase family)
MHAIALTGHICVDIRPELGPGVKLAPGRLLEVGPLAMSLGGCVGNTSRDLSALGADVTVTTGVGEDSLADFVRASLASQPGTRTRLATVPGSSTSYSIILEPAGVDRTIWHNVGANAGFDGSAITTDGVDILHLGYPPLLPRLLDNDGAPLHDLLARARSAGTTTSVDLAVVDPQSPTARLDWPAILARTAAQSDVLSPSLDDLTSALGIEEHFSAGLVERLTDQLLEWGAGIVALSAGTNGLFVRTASSARLAAAGRGIGRRATEWADRRLHVPPVWTGTPITTNGAGDASTAGLLYGIAADADLEQTTLLAAACSAVIVSGRPTSAAAVCDLRPELSDALENR